MRWIEHPLNDGYTLIGELQEGIASLYVEHPQGRKDIKRKFLTQVDLDSVTTDDIEQYFARQIDRVKSKSLDQLKLFCGNT